MAGERISADELFGQNEALIESIGRDAFQYGERMGRQKREELEAHVDLFHGGERGLDEIAARFALKAQDRFKIGVERGEHNTLYMNDAGFIALLAMTAESSQGRHFRSVFEVDQPELNYPEVVDVTHPSTNDASLLGVKFPSGKVELKFGSGASLTDIRNIAAIDMWQSSDLFSQRVEQVFPFGRKGRLSFALHEVVRIETTDGDLWQNPHFSPEGLRLTKKPVDIFGQRG